jgi:H+/Cl- antiporter ClcA
LKRFLADWRNIALVIAGICIIVLAVKLSSPQRLDLSRKVVRVDTRVVTEGDVITELLLQKNAASDLSLPLARVLGNLFTYCAGVIGGVFAPALSAGASLGSWMGGYIPNSDLQIWVLMGMVAFLTGLSRTPFTSLILVLEMTDTHNAILVLMLAAIVAQSAAHIIDPISFYEHMAHRIVHGKAPANEEQQ